MKRILEAQENFYKDRPNMDLNNSVPVLIALLCAEAQELCDTPPEYLTEEKYLEQEIADILLFCLALCRKLSLDPETIMMEKISRNLLKYPSKYFMNGLSFEEARDRSKQQWLLTKGNEEFYEQEAV